jgi:hypothetical protein
MSKSTQDNLRDKFNQQSRQSASSLKAAGASSGEAARFAAALAKPKETVNLIPLGIKPSVPALLKPPPSFKVPETAKAPDFSRGIATISKITPPKSSSGNNKTPKKTTSKTPDFNSLPYSDVKLYPGPLNSQPLYLPTQSSEVFATPAVPAPLPTVKDTSTKSANPADIILDSGVTDPRLMTKLTLEKIGGQELISIARHDTVNGQNVIYQPIKNVSDVAIAYNPQNMISFPDSSDTYFKSFAIKLEAHIPQTTNTSPANNVYLDPDTGNIVIENTALKRDYDIEVEMLSSGKIFNATIYDEDSL